MWGRKNKKKPEESRPLLELQLQRTPKSERANAMLKGRVPNDLESQLSNKESSGRLVMYVLMTVVAGAANQLAFKSVLNKFNNYGFFVSQWTTLLYCVQAILMVCYRLCFVKQGRLSIADLTKVPQKVFFTMGLLDATTATLAAIGGIHTPGELQTLLNQTIIPLTMFVSRMFLGTKYKRYQITGAVLIAIGTVVASLPFLLNPDTSQTVSAAGIILFSASIIPTAFSNVYKESNMKTSDLDVYVTTVYNSFWQEVLGFCFLPLLTLKFMGGLQPSELPAQLTEGFQCFAEIGDDPECDGAFLIFMGYVVVNFGYNVLLLLITKHGSAVLLGGLAVCVSWILLVVGLPCAYFCVFFASHYQRAVAPYHEHCLHPPR
jgi:drug/metabolite transporter (DMT)-like permease